MAYPTVRGQKLDARRIAVEAEVVQYPDYWVDGPMKHLIYVAVSRALAAGAPAPTPPT